MPHGGSPFLAVSVRWEASPRAPGRLLETCNTLFLRQRPAADVAPSYVGALRASRILAPHHGGTARPKPPHWWVKDVRTIEKLVLLALYEV